MQAKFSSVFLPSSLFAQKLFTSAVSFKANVNNNDFFALQKMLNCGQSYKHFMLINYDSRVVPDWKIPHIRTLES